jgi:hypothetical protein
MEFDPVTLTRLSVDRLVDMIQTSDALQNSVSLHAVWKPARTHAPPATPTAARTNLAYQFTEHGPS